MKSANALALFFLNSFDLSIKSDLKLKSPLIGGETKMKSKKHSIITIANQKGGVGKTTSVVNLASAYSLLGLNVLVVDLDYQANTSSLLGVKKKAAESDNNVTFAIKNKVTDIDDVIIKTKFKNIDCLSATKPLGEIPEQYLGKASQFQLLHPFLFSKSINKYELVIIDTHPSCDVLFQSALAASDYYLIPIFPEEDSIEGLGDQLEKAEEVREYQNPMLMFLGCFVSCFKKENTTHRKFDQQLNDVSEGGKFKVFKTRIPSSTSVAAAATEKKPLHHYRPKSRIASAYTALAGEILPDLKGRRKGRRHSPPDYGYLKNAPVHGDAFETELTID